jgi:hypothetical protein
MRSFWPSFVVEGEQVLVGVQKVDELGALLVESEDEVVQSSV